MKKIINFFKKITPSRRKIIQLYAALLYNANMKGFITGDIFQGKSKSVCLPGMNCYSCPGAIGACPLGSLQNALSGSKTRTPMYVLGIILLYCIMLGRTICGYLCPAGFLQELLYKIKTPKLKKNKVTRVLSYLKYVLLVVLVISIPLTYALQNTAFALPGFCKYICPVGTFEGAVFLLINPNNTEFYPMLGGLFTWKFVILILIIISAIFIYRVFCRFLCPLGALYGLFNKISVFGIKVDKSACTHCNKCVDTCLMDVKEVGDHECINCGECIKKCHCNAINWKLLSKVIKDEEVVEETPKKKVNKRFIYQLVTSIFMVVTLIFAFVYSWNVSKKHEKTSGNQIGEVCYSRDLVNIRNGETFNLTQTRGTVTVLNFWGNWCAPCVGELPHFNELANNYKDTVTVVGVHSLLDNDLAESYISENFNDYNITFVYDSLSKEGNEKTAYYFELGGKSAWPMTLILDQDGVIQFIRHGNLSYDELETEVKKLI